MAIQKAGLGSLCGRLLCRSPSMLVSYLLARCHLAPRSVLRHPLTADIPTLESTAIRKGSLIGSVSAWGVLRCCF
jgi:hypothetical protein